MGIGSMLWWCKRCGALSGTDGRTWREPLLQAQHKTQSSGAAAAPAAPPQSAAQRMIELLGLTGSYATSLIASDAAEARARLEAMRMLAVARGPLKLSPEQVDFMRLTEERAAAQESPAEMERVRSELAAELPGADRAFEDE